MNCKQGDIAVVVRSFAGNEGKVVQCLRFVTSRISFPDGRTRALGAWLIEPPLLDWRGMLSSYMLDEQLRPLRDNDGEDEMLRIAGRPKEVLTRDREVAHEAGRS